MGISAQNQHKVLIKHKTKCQMQKLCILASRLYCHVLRVSFGERKIHILLWILNISTYGVVISHSGLFFNAENSISGLRDEWMDGLKQFN